MRLIMIAMFTSFLECLEGASIKFGLRNLAIPLEVSYGFLMMSLGL